MDSLSKDNADEIILLSLTFLGDVTEKTKMKSRTPVGERYINLDSESNNSPLI